MIRGKPFFNTFVVHSACEPCRKKGIEEQCPHMRHMLPPWISASKEADIGLLYKAANREDLHRQENLGISLKANKEAFVKRTVNLVFNRQESPPLARHDLTQDPSTIFVSIDPNAGGKGSDTAMCSAFMDRGTFIICGLESIQTAASEDWDDCLPLIEGHFHALRQIHALREAEFIVFIEGDLGTQAQLIKRHIYTEGRVHNLRFYQKQEWDSTQVESGAVKVGMRTTHLVKERMCKLTRAFLASKRVRFFSECVTLHAPPNVQNPLEEARRLLRT